ncbi:SMI1/KNR4 family protein [Gimesia aquarii]|uniref:SMI1 / KNR4 family protein n=1 Tax=Gimesia aquarii TaxID=2527964 RepID=A0A517X0M9_9PLAN|nr:SMI1/KNR4 family protein [Gimesia aquarii]QDU11063.1 SMI1 / KNR4 family protein [Gimesia aquarii]
MYVEFMSTISQYLIDTGISTADNIRGCTESEIDHFQRRISQNLPLAFIACLHEFGHKCGHLMDGDAFGIAGFDVAREVALELTKKQDSPWQLPENVIPFQEHQGYQFLFFYTDDGNDPSVWHYLEEDSEPTHSVPSFTAWLRESAINVIESKPWNDEICREIRLHRDNWIDRKKMLDEYHQEASQIRRSLIARLVQSDIERDRITGPLEMQQIWNQEFPETELYQKLVAEQKRIPWGWTDHRDA